VLGINPLIGNVVALVVQQVTHIVQQCSGNQFVACAFFCGEMSALESMLELGDRFAKVAGLTARLE